MPLGEGRGVGGPRQGIGGTGYCYCHRCNLQFPHERGTPCSELVCPQCGNILTGVA